MTSILSSGKIPNLLSKIMISSKNLTQTFKKFLNIFFLNTMQRAERIIKSQGYKVGYCTAVLRFRNSAKHPIAGITLSTKSALPTRGCQEHRYDITIAVNGIKLSCHDARFWKSMSLGEKRAYGKLQRHAASDISGTNSSLPS